MRVLVTGSEGHIGRRLVETLQSAGHEARTFDRTARRGAKGDTEHQIGDLRDLFAVRRAVQGMDAVAHLGALAHDGAGSPEDVLSVNVQGTWNVLLACVESDVKRVVYFSSVNALGCFIGQRPPDYFPVDDAHPRHPMSPYQLSKHLGEEACRSFSEKHGIVTVCLRPAFVSAPDHYPRWRERGDRRAEWGKGDYWAYVDVRDVCDATVLGLQAEGLLHGGFLLAADDTTMEIPTSELVETYYPNIPWPTADCKSWLAENPHRALLDCSHAKEALGWRPKHSWREE